MPKDEPHHVSIMFFEPIIQILNNNDEVKQIGASIVLKALIEHIGKKKNLSFIIDNLFTNIIDAIIKTTSESPELFELFSKLIKNVKISCIIENINKILKKINSILKSGINLLV